VLFRSETVGAAEGRPALALPRRLVWDAYVDLDSRVHLIDVAPFHHATDPLLFDWAELGTLAYTVEVGGWSDGFDPPYSSVARFWDENRPMMLYTLRTADNPAAAAGPEVVRQRTGPRPVAAEYFLGQPGQAGSGQPSAPGAAPVVAAGERTLVWSHARDGRGTWGPWTITWSR
jgi:hypothetical protein